MLFTTAKSGILNLMSTPTRQYDLVLFGATGYTGKLNAEYMARHLPTDLRWAIAGRSPDKLETLAASCKKLSPDRVQPAIEVCNLNDEELNALAKKTKVLIAAVGPFAKYGEHAFKACAENGTHYLDITGEVPFVARMIKKYESVAQRTGSLMFPQIGIESAPPDLLTWTLVTMNREEFSAPTGQVIVSIHDLTSKPSGGTLASLFNFFESFSMKELQAAFKPYGLSPIPGPNIAEPPRSLKTKALGLCTDPDLGPLTTSMANATDRPVVQRSWGLYGGNAFYGPNFSFREYMRPPSLTKGILYHFGILLGVFCLKIPLVRMILKKVVYKPGEGPTEEDYANDRVEYRGVGKPDLAVPCNERAFCKVSFEGSLYHVTGVLISEAAISILRDDHELSGGVYTPAMLGQKYIDRLENGGIKFEKSILHK